MTLVDKSKCCGCSACHDACRNGAISMISDRGFLYPKIDSDKCVNCGKCASVCPILVHAVHDDKDVEFEPTAWAAWNTNDEQRQKGASGGLFEAIASYTINNGGFACGCAFSDDFKSCRHIIVESIEELQKAMHSKYLQSEMQNVYSKIRAMLVSGKKGVFCGTPCQVAALSNSLNEDARKRILLVDVFCKGVPSPVVHSKYISHLQDKEHRKIIAYHPKNKDKGWGKFFTKVKYANGNTRYIRSELDSLFVTKALNVRPSCANCAYKGLDRVSDLSIGDYWGVTGIPENEIKRGISAVIINTTAGEKILDELIRSGCIEVSKRTVFDASNARNPGYSQKIELGSDYEQFFDDIEALPFKRVLKKYAQNNSTITMAFRKAKWVWSKVRGISIPKFIYINFLSKHVERGKGAYIIPGSHAIFEFSKGSQLIVEHGKNLVNFRKPKGTKVESWIQLNENARMIIHKEIDIRNCRFIVQKGALLEIGDLEMNGLCNVVVRKKVTIGNDVMIARDVNIYDSDYHPFSIGDDVAQVVSKPVSIEDHVWIGNGASITKGVTIGEGAVVSTRSVVVRNVKPRTMVAGNPAKEMCRDIYWSKGRTV